MTKEEVKKFCEFNIKEIEKYQKRLRKTTLYQIRILAGKSIGFEGMLKILDKPEATVDGFKKYCQDAIAKFDVHIFKKIVKAKGKNMEYPDVLRGTVLAHKDVLDFIITEEKERGKN